MKCAPVLPWLVILSSCSSATAPTPTATAVVERVSVAREVNGDVGRLDATIAVAIHNTMSKTVYFSGCAVSLERLGDNGRWDYVWSPLCLLSAPAEGVIQGVAIPGGTTLHASIAIRTYSNETEWPSTGLPGAYRLRIYLVPEWSSRRVARYLQENWQPTTTNEFSLLPT